MKVLKLIGLERCFARGGREDYNRAMEQKLYEAIVCFPYPVIAVVKGSAVGASWMAAALCDLLVCNEEAGYGYTDAAHHYYPTVAEIKVLEERFGVVQAQDLLFGSVAATGRELRRKGWTCAILAGERMESYAQGLAGKLAEKSQTALRLLKQHLSRSVMRLVKELSVVEAGLAEREEECGTVAAELGWGSEHIGLESGPGKVAIMKFRGSHRQWGGKELVAELDQVLEKIRNSGCRALVWASEDGEFVSLDRAIEDPAIEDPAISDEVMPEVQRLLMETEVPIVAALEGNAQGAGWLISQFCDGCVYSRTGRYSATELGHRAELGARAVATFIDRLGKAVGPEILLSGSEYSGKELEERVGTLLVAEPDQVLGKAVEVAERWARLPQATVREWKKHGPPGWRSRLGAWQRSPRLEKEKEKKAEKKEKESAGKEAAGKLVAGCE